MTMSNKLIFRKAKEMHYKNYKAGSSSHPQLEVEAIQSELALSEEDMQYYLDSLKKLRLIKFLDDQPSTIEITKVGLHTTI